MSRIGTIFRTANSWVKRMTNLTAIINVELFKGMNAVHLHILRHKFSKRTTPSVAMIFKPNHSAKVLQTFVNMGPHWPENFKTLFLP